MPKNDLYYRGHADRAQSAAVAAPDITQCQACEDSGLVADTQDREPWPAWQKLPAEAQFAVRVGLVRPIPCPECLGKPTALDNELEQLKAALLHVQPLIQNIVEKTPPKGERGTSEREETVRLVRLLREICYLIHKDG